MRTFSFFYIWEETFKRMAETKTYAWKFLILFAFLPICTSVLLLFSQSQEVAITLRHIVQSMALGQIDKSFYHILNPVSAFLWQYLLVSLVCTYLISSFYLGLLHIICQRQEANPISVAQAYAKGMKMGFPKGCLLALCLIGLSIEQIFLGSLRIFTALAIVAPVLFIEERPHIFQSLKRSLLLGYLPTKIQAVNGALILITLGLVVQAAESLIGMVTAFICSFDSWVEIPRTLWAINLGALPFSLPTLVCCVITTFGYACLLTFLAYFSATYYRLAR